MAVTTQYLSCDRHADTFSGGCPDKTGVIDLYAQALDVNIVIVHIWTYKCNKGFTLLLANTTPCIHVWLETDPELNWSEG